MTASTWERTRRLVEREAVQRAWACYWSEAAAGYAQRDAMGDGPRAQWARRLARRAAKRAARLRRAAVGEG